MYVLYKIFSCREYNVCVVYTYIFTFFASFYSTLIQSLGYFMNSLHYTANYLLSIQSLAISEKKTFKNNNNNNSNKIKNKNRNIQKRNRKKLKQI